MSWLAMLLKPLVGGMMIVCYKYILYLIERYLPESVSEFLLKRR